MKKEEFLPTVYQPIKYESEIYKKWEESGCFNPDNLHLPKTAENYSIVMPPPNVTGTLHMGHAVMLALEDLLIRYQRMKGKRVLWVPGTDHAAIATQTKVEKILKNEGINRYQLGREKFLKRVEKFARESHNIIVRQIKKMGSSCDWSREAYTLDAVRTRAVRAVFKMMYDDGLIYRGERIVNWCPRCSSVLADDEIEYKAQKTKLYTFRYAKNFPFAIATTRPETKLGDTGVAVNPNDNRYKDYIGRVFEVNFAGIILNLKIVADRGVDERFGTGALGVTPAHSIIDWEIAQENNLPVIKVINKQGKIKNGFGPYSGLAVVKAREKIIAALKDFDLLEKEEEIENNLSICYRCDTPIEPLPSRQWFINVNKKIRRKEKGGAESKINWNEKSIKEVALSVVKSGKIKIIPAKFEKNYYSWIENLRDWCISRQIWFGHQIPVWYNKSLELKNQNAKLWHLKIYGQDIFTSLKTGAKKIEVRAGRQKGEGKYWGDFKTGDIIEFRLADEKTDQIIESAAPIKKIVKTVRHFPSLEKLLQIYQAEDDMPGKNVDYFKNWWQARPDFKKRIENYGVWAIELENIAKENIYVGIDAPAGEGWEQDSDTLDTWFSSGLWTFSALAHAPEEINFIYNRLNIASDDFKRFHPTSVLETGYDILFFWVARMIIMTTYVLQDIPFRHVYLHGLVLDEKGRKMSKSRGNVIDPLIMCEKYGTDATRLSLIMGTAPGADMKLWENKIAGYRNFVNKLWNVARYIITKTESQKISKEFKFNFDNFSLADKWIFNKINKLIIEVSDDLDNYRFAAAGEKLRSFTWDDLADWYLEVSKFEDNKEKRIILFFILKNLLKLWHPFMPFVTEEIWSKIFADKLLMIEPWPEEKITTDFLKAVKSIDVNNFELIKNIIIAIRNARSEHKIQPAKKVQAVIYARDKYAFVKEQSFLIKNLRTGIDHLDIKKADEKIENAIYISVSGVEIYIIGGFDIEKEKLRLRKEISNLEKAINILNEKLANNEFIDKAPSQIKAKEKEKLAKYKLNLENFQKQLEKLS